jgi:hypothetical protein
MEGPSTQNVGILLDARHQSAEEKGCLRPGWSSTRQWSDGLINLRAESERLHLRYKVRVGEGEWEHMTETIQSNFR